MKSIYPFVLFIFILLSCSKLQESSVEDVIATNDIAQIRAKKKEIDMQQKELAAQVGLLNQKLDELDTNKKIPLITAFKAELSLFKHFVELQGDVKTKQNVLIYPEFSGQLQEVYVTEGQKVKKGQVLARIDGGGIQDQVAQLEASTDLAKTTYERQKRLWNQKIGSEIQFLQTETNYLTQKKALEQMKKQLAKTEVTAPFDGIIDDVIKYQGTIVAPGQGSEIFRIVNLRNMFIETEVPETYITDVTKGKKVHVEFPVLGESMESKVSRAGSFINPANRTFKIEVPVSNKRGYVKPNLTAKIRINDYTNKKAVLIPQSIISENAKGEQYIYVVSGVKDVNGNQEGLAFQRTIETGKTQGDFIEVLSGILNGDLIVEEGARSVKSGQIVRISTNK